MKKIKSFLLALTLITSFTLLAGCSTQKASAEGFNFAYNSNAEIESKDDNKYLKIALEVKNIKNEENTLEASKFVLKKGDETVNTSAMIGNNIIDAMETETLEKMASVNLVLTLGIDQSFEGIYELYYNRTKLFDISAKKAQMNNNRTENPS